MRLPLNKPPLLHWTTVKWELITFSGVSLLLKRNTHKIASARNCRHDEVRWRKSAGEKWKNDEGKMMEKRYRVMEEKWWKEGVG